MIEPCFAQRLPRVLSPDQCKIVIEAHLPTLTRSQTISTDGTLNTDYARNCSDGWLFPSSSTQWLFDIMWREGLAANLAHYHFDITDLTALQVLRYRPLQWFLPHFDSNGPAVNRRKLTLVTQLSSPWSYLGGSLSVYGTPSSRYKTRAQGDGMIFPSHALHAANPVLLGTRYALVAWFEGPPLR
ncbi:Oxoglutarate/iron-dependent dioxygenase [uncultured Caudovirales phage]|uniref:Oxoglutarate/iron-dependent dioxygenase n=1 Tax=uncultured Caudovirales phage TaxID=2100421 RepID=A0A6J7WZF4_9CAUD|nr:Oxoglutarate/iron-dependent dioxygenase [uncultured Caudovirales phage]